MSKIKTQIKMVNHDYQKSKGDHLLALLRRMIPNPEWRHESMSSVARFSRYLGYREDLNPALKHVITFPDKSSSLYLSSPLVLAAGANKTGLWIPEMAHLGFGGVTVGTATRQSREGNPHRPRLGMIEADRGIHNSMGLNNPGIAVIADRVDRSLGKAHRKGLSVGISVAETPGLISESEQLEDLVETFKAAYKVSDYVEINVSCPNTGEKRLDLDTHFIEKALSVILQARRKNPVRKAVYAKVSPDLSQAHLTSLLDVLQDLEINGIVLSNTFPYHRAKYLAMQTPLDQLAVLTSDGGKGGLSGRMLYENTFRAVEYIKDRYPQFSLMACGGIDHGFKVWDLMRMGVDAIQCYSVVAYRWFAAHQMRNELLQAMGDDGFSSLERFVEQRLTSTIQTLG